MATQRARKKPVAVDVLEWTGTNTTDIIDFIGDAAIVTPDGELSIRTLEGDLRATIGDWIIRGVHGEFYACKPDIFAKTYDRLPVARPAVKGDTLRSGTPPASALLTFVAYIPNINDQYPVVVLGKDVYGNRKLMQLPPHVVTHQDGAPVDWSVA